MMSSMTKRPRPAVQMQASKCRWQALAEWMTAACAVHRDLQAWAGRAHGDRHGHRLGRGP